MIYVAKFLLDRTRTLSDEFTYEFEKHDDIKIAEKYNIYLKLYSNEYF